MESASKGYVTGVNGNMVNVRFASQVIKNEVGYIHVGDTRQSATRSSSPARCSP